jgi:hypothetical protein
VVRLGRLRALQQAGDEAQVAQDGSEQVARADAVVQAAELVGDRLHVADGRLVDPARTVECLGEALVQLLGAQRVDRGGDHRHAGEAAQVTEEGSALHVMSPRLEGVGQRAVVVEPRRRRLLRRVDQAQLLSGLLVQAAELLLVEGAGALEAPLPLTHHAGGYTDAATLVLTQFLQLVGDALQRPATSQALPAQAGIGDGLVGGYHDDPVFLSGRARRGAPTVPTLRNARRELKSPARCGEYQRIPTVDLQLQCGRGWLAASGYLSFASLARVSPVVRGSRMGA